MSLDDFTEKVKNKFHDHRKTLKPIPSFDKTKAKQMVDMLLPGDSGATSAGNTATSGLDQAAPSAGTLRLLPTPPLPSINPAAHQATQSSGAGPLAAGSGRGGSAAQPRSTTPTSTVPMQDKDTTASSGGQSSGDQPNTLQQLRALLASLPKEQQSMSIEALLQEEQRVEAPAKKRSRVKKQPQVPHNQDPASNKERASKRQTTRSAQAVIQSTAPPAALLAEHQLA